MAGSQEPRTQAQCNGQRITEVVVTTLPPSYGGVFARSSTLNRLVNTLHATTLQRVVQNLVLLHAGERCTILLRGETERLLRAQPFLADASVTAYPDGPNAVRVEVVTIDETSLIGSIGVSAKDPWLHALRLGNSNIGGLGVSALAGWRDGGFYRDTWQTQYANYQLFSSPVQMHLRAVRRDHGYDGTALVAYPFFSDLQRRAWRVAGGASEDLIPFRSEGQAPVSLGVLRRFAHAGAVARVGAPGLLAIIGGAISMERGEPDTTAAFVTDTGLVPDSGSSLRSRYDAFQSARLNLIVGYRQVNFLRVTGFDALNGTQDMRRGVQAMFTMGRALPMENVEDELFLSGNLYAGFGSPTSFAGLEVIGEGRRLPPGEWQALLVSGRLGTYLRPHPQHTLSGSVEYSAGQRQWLPFQLALGDPRGGVRGYEESQLGGAARLVGRLEERWHVGQRQGTADGGVSLFAEVGKLWAGDAPYGVTTGYMPSVGIALLAAIPPRSRRIWRLDFALPLKPTAGASFGIRLTNEDRTRSFWNEPNDVRRNREKSGLVTAFVVP